MRTSHASDAIRVWATLLDELFCKKLPWPGCVERAAVYYFSTVSGSSLESIDSYFFVAAGGDVIRGNQKVCESFAVITMKFSGGSRW